MLIETVQHSDQADLAGVTERPGHDWIGRDLGACMGGADNGIIVSDDLWDVAKTAQAIIDFTAPARRPVRCMLSAQPVLRPMT